MDRATLRRLLRDLRQGKRDIDEVLERMRSLPYEDAGFAKPDTHRALRRDFPEAVYCPGKTDRQIVEVMRRLARDNRLVLATRATRTNFEAVKRGLKGGKVEYHEEARIVTVGRMPPAGSGHVPGPQEEQPLRAFR